MRIYRIEHEGETFEYEAESVYLAVDNWIDEHFDEVLTAYENPTKSKEIG